MLNTKFFRLKNTIVITYLLSFLTSCLPHTNKTDDGRLSAIDETQVNEIADMEKKIDSFLASKGIALFDQVEAGHLEEAGHWGFGLPASQKAIASLYSELGKIIFRDYFTYIDTGPYRFLALRDSNQNVQAVAEFEPLPYSNVKDMPNPNNHVLLHIVLARPRGAKMFKMMHATPAQTEKLGTVAEKIPYAGAFLMYKVFQSKGGDGRYYTEMTLHPENSSLAKHYYPKFGFEKSAEPPHWRFCCGHLWMSVTYREYVKRLSQMVGILEKNSAKEQHAGDL